MTRRWGKTLHCNISLMGCMQSAINIMKTNDALELTHLVPKKEELVRLSHDSLSLMHVSRLWSPEGCLGRVYNLDSTRGQQLDGAACSLQQSIQVLFGFSPLCIFMSLYIGYIKGSIVAHCNAMHSRACCREVNFSKSLAWVFFWCLFMFRIGLKNFKKISLNFS